MNEWSDEESRWLHHEEFVAEVLKRRASLEMAKPSRPRWQRFLESTGGTALITVLLSGLLGQWISLSIQKGAKDREFQQQWLKARGDQALASYNQYLNQENENVQKIYDLIGSSISASADIIILTSPEFAPGSHVGIEAQRDAIRKKFIEADSRWRSEKEKLGLLMSYYHQGQPDVAKAWGDVQEAVTGYMDGARKWYMEHYLSPGDVSGACEKEETDLERALAGLAKALEASRRYAWEGWESPIKMREALERGR